MEPPAAASPSPTPAQTGEHQNPWQRVIGNVGAFPLATVLGGEAKMDLPPLLDSALR
jgi:hypothetical protein